MVNRLVRHFFGTDVFQACSNPLVGSAVLLKHGRDHIYAFNFHSGEVHNALDAFQSFER